MRSARRAGRAPPPAPRPASGEPPRSCAGHPDPYAHHWPSRAFSVFRRVDGKRQRLRPDEPLEWPDDGPDRLQPQARDRVDGLYACFRAHLGPVSDGPHPVVKCDAHRPRLIPSGERVRSLERGIVARERPDPATRPLTSPCSDSSSTVNGYRGRAVVRLRRCHPGDAPTYEPPQPARSASRMPSPPSTAHPGPRSRSGGGCAHGRIGKPVVQHPRMVPCQCG